MGMFDYVKTPEFECPYCEEKIPASEYIFQSKDDECGLVVVDWDEVNNFYGNCPSCDQWIDFKKSYIGKPPFKNYQLRPFKN